MRDFKSSPSFTNHRKRNNTPMILVLLTAVVAGSIYWFMPSKPNTTATSRQKITIPLPLPPPEKSQEAQASSAQQGTPPAEVWLSYEIKSGDSLSRIFKQQGWSHQKLHRILSIESNKQYLKTLHPGQILKYIQDDRGQIAKLAYTFEKVRTRIITLNDDTIHARTLTQQTYKHTAHTTGTIKSSLSEAGKASGLTPKQTMALANIFAWDIDFALDLRTGDTFKLLIQKETTQDDDTLITSDILAAEFTNKGKIYKAIRYTTPDGETSYYTPKGINLKKTFLRSPVKFARISSRFNLHRKHPILNKIRAHKGVDYAASTGTPIRATANGKITHRARKGGYGKTIILQHGTQYSTLYAHMSRYKKGLKRGSTVTQGQTIGYVGHSGLATGPHLHYEFRVNGRHKDPLKVKLPKNRPLNKDYLADFLKTSKPLLAQLSVATENLVASTP